MDNQPKWIEEGREPTPEEWLDWYGVQKYDDALKIAERIITDRHIASGCHTNDHAGRIEHMKNQLKKKEPLISSMNKESMINEILEHQRVLLEQMTDHELAHLVVESRIHTYKAGMLEDIGDGKITVSLGEFLKSRLINKNLKDSSDHPHEGGFL